MAVSIYLCQIWGAAGAALGTGVASVLGHGIIMNVFYHKKVNIDMIVFWKNILRQGAGMLPAFAVGFAMTRWIAIESWLVLLGSALVYTAVYVACILMLSLNEEEKAVCKLLLNKIYPRGERP